MKAVVQDRYGDTDRLRFDDVPEPACESDEVVVRVRAAGLNARDWHVMTGLPYFARVAGWGHGFGPIRPRNPVRGTEVAGVVEAIGSAVRTLRPGQEVFGWCNAAFAEYVAAAESNFVAKPQRLTFEEAAVVPLAGCNALQVLRDQAGVRPGQSVLINGASGGVGTFAVQIAKAMGATVTGVCHTDNIAMVQSLGADHVIDYTKTNFTDASSQYDVIYDIAVKQPLTACRRALQPNGTYVSIGDSGGRWLGGFGRTLLTPVVSLFGSRRLRAYVSLETHDDLVALSEMIEAGHLTPEIDRIYTLIEVPDALAYLAAGHARAKVVVTV